MSLSQTFTFKGDPEFWEPGYRLALEDLTPEQIKQAGRLAIQRHIYPSAPQPAMLRTWALEKDKDKEEKEALRSGKALRGLLKGVNVEWGTDDKGYEFVTIKRNP